MTLKYALKIIEDKTWYRQGGALLPFFINIPYRCMYEELGHDNVFVVQDKLMNWGYFEKLEMKKKSELHLNKYLADNQYLMNRITEWKKAVEKQKELLDKFMKNDDIKELVQEYSKITAYAWTLTMVIEDFDPWGEHIIKLHAPNLTDDEVAVMTSSQNPTFLQQEILDRGEPTDKHYEKYYWYQTSWQHAKTLDKKHFESLKEDKEESKKIIDHIEENQKRKNEISKDLDKETRHIFDFFTELNDWRDIRKMESVCKINYDLWKFLLKLSEINNISTDILMHIKIDELESLTISKEYIEILKKRANGLYIMYFDDKDNLIFTYGKDAEKINDALEKKFNENEIKGRTAYAGKAKGKVKVINTIQEFDKLQEGDILVSIMTRPEMLPVMKKAGAIVTDEGGITCHAAIVARELKIPCIVGTQVATSVLKDNMEVEVDAEKGIVTVKQ